ncbi:MAG: chitobiase/beta-hexosaminidase C-terminal domain-containing protein [Bacteroidota bacterium]
MKPRILLFYYFSFLLVQLSGQNADTLLFSQVFEPSEIARIYLHSSEQNPGIALFQPGSDSIDSEKDHSYTFLLDRLQPAWVLELESLHTSKSDTLYRSENKSIPDQNTSRPPLANYEVIPRTAASIRKNRTLSEYQESFNHISDFIVEDAHIFTIGIGIDKFELSQKTLDYMREAIAQHPEISQVLVFLSIPPDCKGEIKGVNSLGKILKEKSTSVFLPYSSVKNLGASKDIQVHYLRKPEDRNQLYWISLSNDCPTISQISIEETEEFSSECYSVLDDIGAKLPIETTALWNNSAEKPQGYLEIYVKNPSSYPVRLKADFIPNAYIYPSIGEIEATIYPGSDKTLRVQLRSLAKRDTAYPAMIEWAWEFGCMRTQTVRSTLSGILPIHLTSEPIQLLPAQKWAFNQVFPLALRTPVDNATIRYTLDGKEPTLNSAIAPDTLEIAESGTLKTKVFHSNGSHSLTESCVFTKVKSSTGLWQDFYPVNSTYSLGQVSSLLSSKTPAYRKVISTPKEIAISPNLSNYVQVLGGKIEVSDSSTYTLDFYRMPRIMVRVNQGELQEYKGDKLVFPLTPGKHHFEIISLESNQPREFHIDLQGPNGKIPLSAFKLD